MSLEINNKLEFNNEFTSLIENANNIAIIPSKINGKDAFCASCGIYKSLKVLDKNIHFIHTHKVPEGCENLMDNNELISDLFERELHVSIDYSQTSAARVHYSTENYILYLKVKPISKDFDLNNVKAKLTGFNFDLIITVGATALEDLGQVYTELQESFSLTNIINIDNTSLNSKFGKINIVDASKDSICVLAMQKLIQYNYPITNNVAKCFLTGISNTI